MPEVIQADKAKLTMRIILGIARRKIKKEADNAHNDMSCCSNPVFRRIYRKMIEGGNQVKELHHKAVVIDLGTFGLWTIYKDTAYDDLAVWILNELINDKEFCDEVRRSVKPPSEWYVNRWHDSKETTQRLRNEGKLTKYQLSAEEKVFVPAIQEKNWQKIHEECEKEMAVEQRRRGEISPPH